MSDITLTTWSRVWRIDLVNKIVAKSKRCFPQINHHIGEFAAFRANRYFFREGAESGVGAAIFSGTISTAHIRTLSSNDFQGRGPGTRGEELTLSYIQKQFRDMGLEPGNPDGSYLQTVPLVGIRPDSHMTLTFTGHGKTIHLAFEKDFVAQTRRMLDSVHLDADMIFVGYGCPGSGVQVG